MTRRSFMALLGISPVLASLPAPAPEPWGPTQFILPSSPCGAAGHTVEAIKYGRSFGKVKFIPLSEIERQHPWAKP